MSSHRVADDARAAHGTCGFESLPAESFARGANVAVKMRTTELRKVCNYAYSRGDKYTSTVQMTVIRPKPATTRHTHGATTWPPLHGSVVLVLLLERTVRKGLQDDGVHQHRVLSSLNRSVVN